MRGPRRGFPRAADDPRDGRRGAGCPGAVPAGRPAELREPDGDGLHGHRADHAPAVRRPVPRRPGDPRPHLPLRGGEEGGDRLPRRGDQPHGLVSQAGEGRQGPVPGLQREPREARVLHQREDPRRGRPAFRVLHDRVQRSPLGLPALVPQEQEGAGPVLRPARSRRGDGLLVRLREAHGGEVREHGLPEGGEREAGAAQRGLLLLHPRVAGHGTDTSACRAT